MQLKWLGQGGYIFIYNNLKICIDPYLSNYVQEKEGLERLLPIPISPEDLSVDMIIFTHNHIDHLDPQTIAFVQKDQVKFVGPDSCKDILIEAGINENAFTSLNQGNKLKINDISLKAVYAKHTIDSIGLVLSTKDTIIYLTGDTEYDKKLLEIKQYNPDILISCINGKWGNMNIAEAVQLAEKLEVKITIPSHYGMFAENTANLDKFRECMKQSDLNYRELPFNKYVTL